MSWRRGTAIVSGLGRLVQLTGAQDLRNLEASGELKLEELLVTASDGVFDRLSADGIDAGALTNPEVYERTVAFSLLGVLGAQGYLSSKEEGTSVAERYFQLADRFYEQVRPRLRGRTEPRTASEGLPSVCNP